MPYPAKTNRETVLNTAVRELARVGLRDLSLRSVAAQLKLAPNAIYRYFPSKAELENALTGHCVHLLLASIKIAVAQKTGQNAIRATAKAYLKFARREPALYGMLLSGGEVDCHNDLWDYAMSLVEPLAGPARANKATVALWAFLHGIVGLEAANVFTKKKPATSLEFGLEAWLAAARTAAVPKTNGKEKSTK